MKNIRRLSLVVIASFVFSMCVFAAPAEQVQPANTATSEKSNTPVTVTATDIADRSVNAVEQVTQLHGQSTYALSTCPPTFTPIANTIERAQPETPPPIG